MSRLDGSGPFLWLNESGPRSGFRALPPGGMCVSAFLFVERDGRLLLGKYADDARWEDLTGLDEDRWRAHGKGWTLPASHVKYGEDPRETARRVMRDVLRVGDFALREPLVGSDHYVPARFPELGMHYDLWFLFRAHVPPHVEVARPPWYAELEWLDPRSLPASAWARGHEDVVARWAEFMRASAATTGGT